MYDQGYKRRRDAHNLRFGPAMSVVAFSEGTWLLDGMIW